MKADQLASAIARARWRFLSSQVEFDRIALPLFWRFADVADDEDVPMPIGAKNEVGSLGGALERAVLFDL